MLLEEAAVAEALEAGAGARPEVALEGGEGVAVSHHVGVADRLVAGAVGVAVGVAAGQKPL